jgi:hypothetical protein
MRSSYIVPIHGKVITLPRDLQEQLNIGKDCLLYAKIADHNAVLSSLPPTSWAKAYRLVVHIADRPGTLAKVANIFSEMGINFLLSWTAAVTSSGEGCLTSVIELPASLVDKGTEEIRERLRNSLEKDGLLSRADLFHKSDGLRPVHLTPLSVLAAMGSESSSETYEIHIRDWALDLHRSTHHDGYSLYDQLLRFIRHGPTPTRALLTPDTEERYFRIALLPPNASFFVINFNLQVTSSSGDFSGYFQRALEVIARHRLNMYSARNHLIEKTVGDGHGHEMAFLSFVVDTSDAGAEPQNVERFRRTLHRDLLSHLSEYSRSHNSEVVIPSKEFSYTVYEVSWPRCFLATNVKDPGVYRTIAGKLYRELVALGLHPVNVDITMRETVLGDVTLLLDSCPLLISLHVPEEKNRLMKSGEGDASANYVPSDWVIFEESYMRGLGRKVFRMRDESVREPAFGPGSREYRFTPDTFEKVLAGLANAIRRHMTTVAWRKDLEASAKAARDFDDPALLQRELQGEFFDET